MTDRKIIGWRPLYERQPGGITTQAFVLCSNCRAPIDSMGGPVDGALCLNCIKADLRQAGHAGFAALTPEQKEVWNQP